jgi:hypothetical protein
VQDQGSRIKDQELDKIKDQGSRTGQDQGTTRFELAKDTSFQRFALILRFKIHPKALQVLKALHVFETDLDLSRQPRCCRRRCHRNATKKNYDDFWLKQDTGIYCLS